MWAATKGAGFAGHHDEEAVVLGLSAIGGEGDEKAMEMEFRSSWGRWWCGCREMAKGLVEVGRGESKIGLRLLLGGEDN